LILCAILMTFMWNLNEGRILIKSSDRIIIEFGLNLMKCAVILFLILKLVYFPCIFSRADYSFFSDFFFVKLRKTINKIRVAASIFFSNLFLCLSQLSQATLRPELQNFVQKSCPLKRLIYDWILKSRSFGVF